MNELSSSEAMVLLEQCCTVGCPKSSVLEYWVGGGLPPPSFRSDQFMVHTRGDATEIALSRPWYGDYDVRSAKGQAFLNEVWSAPATRDHVVTMASLLRDAFLAGESLGEGDRRSEDQLVREISIWLNGRRYLQRWRGARTPPHFEPLARFAADCAVFLQESGSHYLKDVNTQQRFAVPSPDGGSR